MTKKPERFIVTTRWRKLTKEEQIEEVREAMVKRHTNKSAARALGTKPGIIAGIRWRNDIESAHKPRAAVVDVPKAAPPPEPSKPKVPAVKKPALSKPKPEPVSPAVPKPKPAPPPEPPKPKPVPVPEPKPKVVLLMSEYQKKKLPKMATAFNGCKGMNEVKERGGGISRYPCGFEHASESLYCEFIHFAKDYEKK